MLKSIGYKTNVKIAAPMLKRRQKNEQTKIGINIDQISIDINRHSLLEVPQVTIQRYYFGHLSIQRSGRFVQFK